MRAAGSPVSKVFLEAAPGSGKTTVAAQRFGLQRYSGANSPDDRPDPRAVLAVSFTRSATLELKTRVRRVWGPTALTWPHRIVTLDAVLEELLSHLLSTGTLHWPGGHTALDVHDSWKVLVRHASTKAVAQLTVDRGHIRVKTNYAPDRRMRPEPAGFKARILAGTCTHDDVRVVLRQALRDPEIAALVARRLNDTTRALIVDEVFDANKLDISIVEMAASAGIPITLVGDPWQALYGFRGARPDLVLELLTRTEMTALPLRESFRWKTVAQSTLAGDLRGGRGVVLEELPAVEAGDGMDVVLASVWRDLWSVGSFVLPMAFGSAKGNLVEAATTLLLSQVTTAMFGISGTYRDDALATLGITDADAVQRLQTAFTELLSQLQSAHTRKELDAVYLGLISAVRTESPRQFPLKSHKRYTDRLRLLQERLQRGTPLVPGMTIHQAKGREWDVVGLQLTSTETSMLAEGLDRDEEKHRQLYVACTRAVLRTVRLTPI